MEEVPRSRAAQPIATSCQCLTRWCGLVPPKDMLMGEVWFFFVERSNCIYLFTRRIFTAVTNNSPCYERWVGAWPGRYMCCVDAHVRDRTGGVCARVELSPTILASRKTMTYCVCSKHPGHDA